MYQDVRVESADGMVLGAAILVAEDLLLTCAHLTVGRPTMKITFPGRPGAVSVTAKQCTRWARSGDHGDIALLEITEPRTLPAGVRPCRFASLDAPLPAADLPSSTLTAVGFPASTRSQGVHATVSTNASRWLESEWLQIDVREAHLQHLDNGFSGAAVRLPSNDVVGMVTDSVDPRRQGYVGKMLPLRTIRRYWPGLVDRLPDEPPELPRDLPACVVDVPTRTSPEEIFRLAFPQFDAPNFVSVWDAAMYAHDNVVVPDALHRFLTTLAAHVDDPAKRDRLRGGLDRWH
ncbi:MAG TPA: trypsin-like serine protease, partial [Pseudonocardiaceae bacterium]